MSFNVSCENTIRDSLLPADFVVLLDQDLKLACDSRREADGGLVPQTLFVWRSSV